MPFPPPNQAKELLAWADGLNPGPWSVHSLVVANAAKTIAGACGLDADRAFSLGLLHDVGRYAGRTDLRHVYDGFVLLRERGFAAAAQICLTHSFPSQDFSEYSGRNDLSQEQSAELERALARAVFTDYDRLIQLCDSLALVDGVCLMEKRLVDVARRHGANKAMLHKWESLFTILERFNRLAGQSVYSLFPDISQNTFS